MFFYLGNTPPVTSLQCVAPGVYLDQGWECINGAWVKGYSTECSLVNSIPSILNGYSPRGKWCVIKENKIYHSVRRGFPLYQNNNEITNLKILGAGLKHHFDVIPSSNEIISLDDAADIMGKILIENIKNFYKFNNVSMLNILFTGGLDSLTVWALTDFIQADYSLNVYIPKPEDRTLQRSAGLIREYENDLTTKVSADYWGYNITSLYKNTNWYATGFYAEISQLRTMPMLNYIANFTGKTVDDLATPSDYIYGFLQQPHMKIKIQNYKTSIRDFKDEDDLYHTIYNCSTHDYQMWHLDNNFHFSPFYDERLLEVANKLSISDRIANALNGIIQRKIIEKYNPDYLMLLSRYKNFGPVFENFKQNFQKIKLRPEITVNIR